MAANSGTSQPLHTRVGTRGQYPRSRSLLARVAPVPPGPRCFCGLLPADSPAELGRLALLLALLEPPLEGGKEDHRYREEHHHAKREEGDDPVVGLADEALAVVAGEERDLVEEPHAQRTIPGRLTPRIALRR